MIRAEPIDVVSVVFSRLKTSLVFDFSLVSSRLLARLATEIVSKTSFIGTEDFRRSKGFLETLIVEQRECYGRDLL